MSNRWMRNSLVYLLIVIAVITAFFIFNRSSLGGPTEVPINQVIEMARSNASGGLLEIKVSGDNITVTNGSQTFTARKESGITMAELLSNADVPISNYSLEPQGSSGLSTFIGILIGVLPFLLMFGFLIFIMRQAQGSNNQTMGFGRSRARLFVGTKATVTFFDVAGVPEAKEELEEVVEFLKYPERFQALGARIPKGVLLYGPPGTGKTLLARAVAGEAGVPFFSISGSEFVEMFVGVGASRVRDLFDQAKRHSPCIIFIDEIDAVGRHRGAGLGGGHDEREQTLNQILVEMDGFETSTNVIVIAATNRPDILDPALLRPGRFDRRVTIDNPDIRGRTAILDVHAKGKPLEKNVDMQDIARQTPGFSGADLANLINEAALLAARRNRKTISLHELTEAIDRVSMGPARKSKVMSKEERALVAYHEAGHAMVAHFMPEGKAVGKMSIISRGHAGGFTRYEQEDSSLQTRPELEAMIASAMGGRVAEVMKFGKVTTGASSDIEQATKIARGMVTQFGMSEKLGLRMLGKREGGAIFLGREMSEQRDYSLKTEVIIDGEIDRLLKEGEENAQRILTTNGKQLDALAVYLLEHETIESSEFKELMAGKDPSTVRAPRFGSGLQAETPPTGVPAEEEEGPAHGAEPEPTLG
ncbi:MAG: ATP-dependent zinc metalloprotease FtsH [Chloroflexi bacterium]|nr:ATP-dependent zinc metalloprotease FtsH [Chloroflexota bacterium]